VQVVPIAVVHPLACSRGRQGWEASGKVGKVSKVSNDSFQPPRRQTRSCTGCQCITGAHLAPSRSAWVR
jgi:hypothetical protein